MVRRKAIKFKGKLGINEVSQTECHYCGEFYRDDKEKCPSCGVINLDRNRKGVYGYESVKRPDKKHEDL